MSEYLEGLLTDHVNADEVQMEDQVDIRAVIREELAELVPENRSYDEEAEEFGEDDEDEYV